MSCYIIYKGKNYTQEDFLDFLKSQIPTKTFTWARRAENSYEVSSKGDTRFSALNAKLKDGRTIEEAYQLDVKGYRAQGDNWRLGKGKAPLTSMTKEQIWQAYKNLWRQFLQENPTLEQDLREKASGKVLTDMFASTDVSQARALAELLNEKTFNESKGDSKQEIINNYYEGDIIPEPNTVFVFGSNLEGRHGAGAAKIARGKFGAIYGQGEGLQGNAYALPTKDLRVKENKGFKSISPSEIIESIKKLYQTAVSNSTKQFKVAYRNTTTTSLNGYTGLEMIEMFKQAGPIPSNIVFSKEWYDVMSNPSVVESQQVSQPKVDIRAKVYELFNLQGYMDIKTNHKTDKNLIAAISHYVLEDLGYKTDQEKLQAVREGFKLSEYITTEQISDVHTRVRLNMKNIIEDEVDDGPVSLGGINFTSSGYESNAKNAFTCK